MFEGRFEQPTQPQLPEREQTEEAREQIKDFLGEVICAMKNVISQLEGEIERLSFGPDGDEQVVQTYKTEKGLIEEGLILIESRGRELGVIGS